MGPHGSASGLRVSSCSIHRMRKGPLPALLLPLIYADQGRRSAGRVGLGGDGHPQPTLASPRLSCSSLLPLPRCCYSRLRSFSKLPPLLLALQATREGASTSGRGSGAPSQGPGGSPGPAEHQAGPQPPRTQASVSALVWRSRGAGQIAPELGFRDALLSLGLFPTARCHFFLQGGDAKLQVIVCVSPGQRHVAETLQSLGFGARARQVERGCPAPRKLR